MVSVPTEIQAEKNLELSELTVRYIFPPLFSK